MSVKLLIATGNSGKIDEFRALLAGFSGELFTLQDLKIDLQVDETGATYRENAALKALAYARRAGMPALSDDTGLEVDALGGEPGIRSARCVPGAGATDADRCSYVLRELSGRPRPWTARFRCVAAVGFPDGRILFGEGLCEGEIIPQPRGRRGFGYDPIFRLPAGRTMAELSLEAKNRLSHRALAVRAVLARLQGYFDAN